MTGIDNVRHLFALILASACLMGCGGSAPTTSAIAADLAASPRDLATIDASTPPDLATPPDMASCADDIALAGVAGCAFYECREGEHACGASGYYLGFGYKYCVRFLTELRPKLSPAGQTFLDSGRDCLMRAIDSRIPADLACSDVRTQALQSHVACYRDSGFCSLSVADRAQIFLAVDPADLDLTTALETQLSCF